MRRFRSRHIGYVLFGIILLYVLILWSFPCDQVRTAAIQGLEEVLPARVSLGKVSLSFPFYFHVENIRVESGPLSFQLPDMDLVPQILPFLKGKTAFQITDVMKPHRLRGEYQIKNNAGEMKISLENLELKTQYEKDFSFQTRASGEGTFQWVGEDFDRRNGKAWLLLEKGKIQGGEGQGQPPFLLGFIERVRAEFRIERGIMNVNRLEVNGKEMKDAIPGGSLPDLGMFLQPSLK